MLFYSLQAHSDVAISPAAQTQQLKPSAMPSSAVGTTYVHWGKSTCNNGANLVYSGMIMESKPFAILNIFYFTSISIESIFQSSKV